MSDRERDLLDAITELEAGDEAPPTDMTEAEARDITAQIRSAATGLWDLVSLAYKRRAWIALGHPSWDVYVIRELGTGHIRIPREDRTEVVTSLRAAGLSVRAIGDVTNLGSSTVQRELADAGATVPGGTVVGRDGRRRPAARPDVPAPTDTRDAAERALAHPDAVQGRFRQDVHTPLPNPRQGEMNSAQREYVERQREAKARAKRGKAIKMLQTRGRMPEEAVAAVIAEVFPTPEMAIVLHRAIVAKWGSWESFTRQAVSKR